MGSRRLLILVALAAAGCGPGAAAQPPPGPAAATLLVTRDFGAARLRSASVAPGQSALNALRRSAHVTTAYDGRFVTAIDGLKGNAGAASDWLYFVNGIDPGVGAADIVLHPGDREWWDYRYWKDMISAPAVIGAWPEPFVHGLAGAAPAVGVDGPACDRRPAQVLRSAGARLVDGAAAYRLSVVTWAADATVLAAGAGSGLTVAVHHGLASVYDGRGGWRELPEARAVILARVPGGVPGRSFELVVAGADRAAACAAARTLADHPGQIAGTYAVALDATGRVIARGGRP